VYVQCAVCMHVRVSWVIHTPQHVCMVFIVWCGYGLAAGEEIVSPVQLLRRAVMWMPCLQVEGGCEEGQPETHHPHLLAAWEKRSTQADAYCDTGWYVNIAFMSHPHAFMACLVYRVLCVHCTCQLHIVALGSAVLHVLHQALGVKWTGYGINGVPHYHHSGKRFSWVAPVTQELWQCSPHGRICMHGCSDFLHHAFRADKSPCRTQLRGVKLILIINAVDLRL